MDKKELKYRLNLFAFDNKVDIDNLRVIPKSELSVGQTYAGICRNADKAIWLGDCFEYQRYKFGYEYPEKINHFEDDNEHGYDVFVPIEIIEK